MVQDLWWVGVCCGLNCVSLFGCVDGDVVWCGQWFFWDYDFQYVEFVFGSDVFGIGVVWQCEVVMEYVVCLFYLGVFVVVVVWCLVFVFDGQDVFFYVYFDLCWIYVRDIGQDYELLFVFVDVYVWCLLVGDYVGCVVVFGLEEMVEGLVDFFWEYVVGILLYWVVVVYDGFF